MYLPDFLTGFIPLLFCVTDVDSDSLSATLSLVFTVNVDTASTIGLTPVILALSPAKGSSSAVEWRGINSPCWFGRQDTAHNVATGAWTTILNLGNSVINPSSNNGGWNESTGIFTVQSGQAGFYYVYGQTAIDDIQDNDIVRAGFSKNDGTVPLYSQMRTIDQGANVIVNSGLIAQTVSLAVGDTIKLQVYHNEGSTEPTEPIYCFFGGYRLSI